jgi:hypothetical protein
MAAVVLVVLNEWQSPLLDSSATKTALWMRLNVAQVAVSTDLS